ncbi:hypothetical protein DUNSADRAFT_15603 [Dunaliella salina]|uniref:MD-2-related lipid-recognition domain-containing protein n=1 Tax=Dunaliella salina TaxID=3046 RepID=A0ABQ7H1K8_DUNSA|nr:hypothetical protein DUNSADRAFT_15603 [Dunaliella salina]|eukprot:KAF5840745.1 hypothetical protein DUNSADRAFT_15603 [Dunaliella salina]
MNAKAVTIYPILLGVEVALSPDPGLIGTPATFKINGMLKEDVTGGAVGIEVSFSGVPIFATSEDLCNKFAGACPRPAGPVDITIVEALPPIAPPGFYGLRLTAQDQAGTDLLCLTVDFELQLPSGNDAGEAESRADVKRIDQGWKIIAPR